MSELPPAHQKCVFLTGKMTKEATQIAQRVEADPEAPVDQYDLATPICPERVCALSLEDYLNLLNSATDQTSNEPTPAPDIEQRYRRVGEEVARTLEWLPEDCPLRTGQFPDEIPGPEV